jgi:hypothetical protein
MRYSDGFTDDGDGGVRKENKGYAGDRSCDGYPSPLEVAEFLGP